MSKLRIFDKTPCAIGGLILNLASQHRRDSTVGVVMRAEDVRELMSREPFVPLKLVKTDGKSLPIKFRRVLVPMKTFVIVFKGIESATSSFAKKGFEEFPYENIARLEPVRPHKRGNGKNNGRGHK